jgi:hypothetical protein
MLYSPYLRRHEALRREDEGGKHSHRGSDNEDSVVAENVAQWASRQRGTGFAVRPSGWKPRLTVSKEERPHGSCESQWSSPMAN